MMKILSNKTLPTFSLIALLLSSAAGRSNPISIGSTTLQIPNPPGFAPITQQMTRLFRVQQCFVDSTNVQYMFYIAESDIPSALRDELLGFSRWFSVQTPKSLLDGTVPKSFFLQCKQFMKTQMHELTKQINDAMPGWMENLSQGITEQFDLDVALSMSHIVPLPPHEETDRTFAYSQFMKVVVDFDAGTPIYEEVVAGTSTLVYVRGKVLFLYSYAEESGLEWTREVSRQWANSIVAANSSGLLQRARESYPRIVRILWGGAIMGGNGALFCLASLLDTKRYADRLREQLRARGKGKIEPEEIDKIVADVERDLTALKDGKLFCEGQEKVESPKKMADRILRDGYVGLFPDTVKRPKKDG